MKKSVFFLFIFIATLTSCSLDEDETNDFYLEVMPIESVEAPEQFIHGETYEVLVSYNKPSSCYQFNDFLYEINGHERTIAVVNTVYNNSNCFDGDESVTVGFDFTVNGTETYVFKFFQGEDENGIDQYYLVEIPVVTGRTSVSEGGR